MRYEVAVGVGTGQIVWAHGPWPAGTSDVQIFRSHFKDLLIAKDEFSIADNGLVTSDVSGRLGGAIL